MVSSRLLELPKLEKADTFISQTITYYNVSNNDVVKQIRADGGFCTEVYSEACGVVGVDASVAWQSVIPRRRKYENMF